MAVRNHRFKIRLSLVLFSSIFWTWGNNAIAAKSSVCSKPYVENGLGDCIASMQCSSDRLLVYTMAIFDKNNHSAICGVKSSHFCGSGEVKTYSSTGLTVAADGGTPCVCPAGYNIEPIVDIWFTPSCIKTSGYPSCPSMNGVTGQEINGGACRILVASANKAPINVPKIANGQVCAGLSFGASCSSGACGIGPDGVTSYCLTAGMGRCATPAYPGPADGTSNGQNFPNLVNGKTKQCSASGWIDAPSVSNGTPPIAPSYTCSGVTDPGGSGTLYSGEGSSQCTWKIQACPAGYIHPDGSGYCYNSWPAKPLQKTCNGVLDPAGSGGTFHVQTDTECMWKKLAINNICPTGYRNLDSSGYCYDTAPVKVPTCTGQNPLDPNGSLSILHAGEGTSNCIWKVKITSCPTGYSNLDSSGYCYDTAPAKKK